MGSTQPLLTLYIRILLCHKLSLSNNNWKKNYFNTQRSHLKQILMTYETYIVDEQNSKRNTLTISLNLSGPLSSINP